MSADKLGTLVQDLNVSLRAQGIDADLSVLCVETLGKRRLYCVHDASLEQVPGPVYIVGEWMPPDVLAAAMGFAMDLLGRYAPGEKREEELDAICAEQWAEDHRYGVSS